MSEEQRALRAEKHRAALERYLAKRSLPCIHLGEPTGETVNCQTCRGGVALKTFKCELHTGCTPEKKVDGIACCRFCADYTPTASDNSVS